MHYKRDGDSCSSTSFASKAGVNQVRDHAAMTDRRDLGRPLAL